MEFSVDYTNTVKEFINNNIITIEEYNQIDSDFRKISILTGNIQINGETEYNGPKYKMKAMLLPNSNYNLIKYQILKAYKLLNCASNKQSIKTIFLIGYSHLSVENNIYLSNYTSYDTINPEVSFNVDLYTYSQLQKVEKVKWKKFEQNTYTIVSLGEDGDEIFEKEQTITESIEDREYTFDIHLALLSYVFPKIRYKINICPLWINIKNPSVISLLGNILSQYYTKDEYFFIFSTNMTHFGKLYDYSWDDKFLPILQESPQMQKIISEKYRDCITEENLNSNIKNEFREMLRNDKKKEEIKKLIQILDNYVIDAIKNKYVAGLEKLNNISFCKEIIMTLIEMIKAFRNLTIGSVGYDVIQCKTLEEMRDMNFVSFCSLILYETGK